MTVDKSSLSEELQGRQIIKRLGFPRVEDWESVYRYDQGEFLRKVRDSMIDMNDQNIPQEVKDNVEFTINMADNQKHLLEIDVKRNETRANELKVLREKMFQNGGNDTDFIDSDILVFYIDGFSRQSLARSTPKLYKWLSRFVDEDPETDAYQFFRYHDVKDNTYLNNHALYFGTMGEIVDDTNNVFQYFSDKGFITSLIRDQ